MSVKKPSRELLRTQEKLNLKRWDTVFPTSPCPIPPLRITWKLNGIEGKALNKATKAGYR
jgi:hypothetical protein